MNSNPRAPVSIGQQTGNLSLEAAAHQDLHKSLRTTSIACLIVVMIFVGIFGVWSAWVPLASAAIAQGVVSPEGSRKTVQHLEGGIIKEFRAREGDRVQEGDVLIVLDKTQPSANHMALQAQRLRLLAMKLRIDALQRRASELDLAAMPAFKAAMADSDFSQFVANETQIFETRRRTLEQQSQIYDQQIQQLHEEIKGLDAQITSVRSQLEFIEDELKDTRWLLGQGLARKPRVLELQRTQAGLIGQDGNLVSTVAKAKQKIEEIKLAQLDLSNKFFNEQNDLLAKTNSDLAQTDERINTSKDVLARTEILAPITGVVVNTRFKTMAGVIRAGEPILDIVPTEEDLVIEARLSPNDIDAVKPGQVAQVHLTPYHTRYTQLLHGTLRDISADTLTDEKTGMRYYRANVVVDHSAVEEIGENIRLAPGMPAEIYIRTGEHTLFTYLFEPFTRSLRRSFREK
jgi:HlyD family type I secretion membrane fusion protein